MRRTEAWELPLDFARGREERTAFSEYYSQGIYTAMFMLRKRRTKYVHYVNRRAWLTWAGTREGEGPGRKAELRPFWRRQWELKVRRGWEQLELDSKGGPAAAVFAARRPGGIFKELQTGAVLAYPPICPGK